VKALGVVLVVLLMAGCGSRPAPAPAPKTDAAPAAESSGPAPVVVSYAQDVQPILTTSCLPCHAAGGGASKYDLTKYESVSPLVVVGGPDSSRLYQVLASGKMPPSGKLDPAKLATIRKWIAEGGKNN